MHKFFDFAVCPEKSSSISAHKLLILSGWKIFSKPGGFTVVGINLSLLTVLSIKILFNSISLLSNSNIDSTFLNIISGNIIP